MCKQGRKPRSNVRRGIFLDFLSGLIVDERRNGYWSLRSVAPYILCLPGGNVFWDVQYLSHYLLPTGLVLACHTNASLKWSQRMREPNTFPYCQYTHSSLAQLTGCIQEVRKEVISWGIQVVRWTQ